jgi:hypothetical protein
MVSKKLPERKVKRLFWDIETSHNVVLAFRIGYKLHIGPESILSERKIICIAYKWEGEKKVHILTWDKNQCDKEMIRDFLLVAHEADELVAHWGDRSDCPTFRTRCLAHGFKCPPPWKTVDTCAWAKKYFNFNCLKLDYISKFLGGKGKLHTGFQLWKDVLIHNCPKALATMCDYNKEDVNILEFIYHKMKHCVKPKTHAGVFAGKDKWTCPRTGSENVKKDKTRVTSAGVKQHQMKNMDDGTYYTISDSAYKVYQTEKNKKK